MAEPVIVDDGGSTRIRQVKDNGYEMDTFLINGTATASGPFKDAQGNPKVVVRISTVNDDGSFKTPGNPADWTDVNMVAGDKLTISTSTKHTVNAQLDPNGNLSFVIDVSAGDRFIEARQTRLRRRYIVLNGGVIEAIDLSRDNEKTSIFTSNPKTIYTCVAFT